jgi:hypothetical protein
MLVTTLFALSAAGIAATQHERRRAKAWDTLLKLSLNPKTHWLVQSPYALEKWAQKHVRGRQHVQELLTTAPHFVPVHQMLHPWFARKLGRHANLSIIEDLVMETTVQAMELHPSQVSWAAIEHIARNAARSELQEMGVFHRVDLNDVLPFLAAPELQLNPPDPIRPELELFSRFFIDRASLEELEQETGVPWPALCRELTAQLEGLSAKHGYPRDQALDNNRLVWACRLASIDRESLPPTQALVLSRRHLDLVQWHDVDQLRGAEQASAMGIALPRSQAWINDRVGVARDRVREHLKVSLIGPSLTREWVSPEERRRFAYIMKKRGYSWLEIGRLIGHTDPRSMAYRYARAHRLPWPPHRTDDPLDLGWGQVRDLSIKKP